MAERVCGLCGEPMPVGEDMFEYHGYSGPCPKPPKRSLPPDENDPTLPCRLSVGVTRFDKGVRVAAAQGAIDRMYDRMRKLDDVLDYIATYEPEIVRNAKSRFNLVV